MSRHWKQHFARTPRALERARAAFEAVKTSTLALVASALLIGGAPPASNASVSVVADAPSAAQLPPHASRAAEAPAEKSPAPVVPAPNAPNWSGAPFQRALSELAAWATKNHGRLGAQIRDVVTGRELGAVAADKPENPASNQKLVTTAAALAHLGAEYRFKTTLCGRREGNLVRALVLRSNGDPSLAYPDLESMAQALAHAGVLRVGQVLVDQSYFDDSFVPPAFEQQPREWAAFRAPVSAVSLERNATTLHVAAESERTARVWFEPPGFVDVTGRVQVKKTERAENVRLTLKPVGRRLEALVAGSISPGAPEFRWSRRVDDPLLYAGYALSVAVKAAGIQVEGDVALGGQTETSELVVHESRPLSELLPELGKQSDNFYAETLLKALGAQVLGVPGTSANGAKVALAYLHELDALDPATRITNGSGLFDANRVSPRALVKTLIFAYRSPLSKVAFVEQLAVGGVDGTLQKRFVRYRAQRMIRAKTGTLSRVVALSGYVFRPDGSFPVAFSLIMSDLPGMHAEVRQRIDGVVEQIAEKLASFP